MGLPQSISSWWRVKWPSGLSKAADRSWRGDAFADAATYDLVLVMDVVEHVEDCFGFLRRTRQKGRWKLYHIPLDAYATAIVRGVNEWDTVGHVHLFTMESALKTVEHTGHRVIDWVLTDPAVGTPNRSTRTRVFNLLRRPLAMLSARFAARLMGGYSILILAE